MDSGADRTQKIVVGVAIVLGIIIVSVIGLSLYNKAKVAEGQLANKVALDIATKKTSIVTGVSLTGEARNSPTVSYDGLVQRRTEEAATTTNLGIINDNISVTDTATTTPKEVEEFDEFPDEVFDGNPVEPTPPVDGTVIYNPNILLTDPLEKDPGNRPLSYEEILSIRRLPIENSPAGVMQQTLEKETKGEYTARK